MATNNMKFNLIHHYTDINTLALILKHKTIRFNRLDRVDDLTEGSSFKKLNLGKFFYVSCWTHDPNESIPQWNMYTPNMAGVRVSLPTKMFDYKPLVVPKEIEAISNGEIISPIPFEKMLGEKFFIPPIFMDEKKFGRIVDYPPDFQKKKNEAIEFEVSQDGKFKGKISEPTIIAALKDPDWSFQKEYRFILFVMPSPSIPQDKYYFKNLADQLPNFVSTSLYNGEGPEENYLDIALSQDAINQLSITVGPCCTEGDYLIIESLKEKYSPSGQIKKSKYTNTIRCSKNA